MSYNVWVACCGFYNSYISLSTHFRHTHIIQNYREIINERFILVIKSCI